MTSKPAIVREATLDLLYQANGVPEDQQAAFRDRVLRGALADVLFRDVRYVPTKRSHEDILKEVSFDSFSAELARARQDARAVLLVGAHVGLFDLGLGGASHVAGDAFRVGAATPGDGASFGSVRANPDQALYNMVKHLKKPGSVGLIGGDGPYGGGKHRVELLGREVALAPGAPFVIYHAKCLPIWYMAGWEGERIVLSYEPGPVPEQGEKYDAWLTRWFAFYAGKLRDVATGDPRNVRGRAGIWSLLRKAGKKRPAARRARSKAVSP